VRPGGKGRGDDEGEGVREGRGEGANLRKEGGGRRGRGGERGKGEDGEEEGMGRAWRTGLYDMMECESIAGCLGMGR